MGVTEMQPGEDIYQYLSRMQRELGTDYVYILYGTEVIAPTSGDINVEMAKTVLDYAKGFTKGMSAGLNVVVATLEDFEGEIMIKKIGDDTYLIAFVQPSEKAMEVEEITF